MQSFLWIVRGHEILFAPWLVNSGSSDPSSSLPSGPLVFHVSVFNQPNISVAGRLLHLPVKGVAALSYLALAETPVARKKIARLLWPNPNGHRSGLHSLSQLLYDVKKEAGVDLVEKQGSSLVLRACTVDAADFQAAIKAGNYKSAAYSFGQFLDQFESGSARFDQWADQKRGIFNGAARDDLLPGLAADGLWGAVIEVCSILLRSDRYDPNLWEWLIRAHLLTGDRDGAQTAIERASAVWVDELESEFPIPANDLLAIDQRHSPRAAANAGSLPFVGRREEMGKLAASWERAASGCFSTVIVSGESGIGKTALLDRICRLIAIRGGRSIFSSGYALERNVPLGIFSQLINEGADLLSGPPKLSEAARATLAFLQDGSANQKESAILATPFTSRHSLMYAGTEILEHLAKNKPLAICIDDVQWADVASLELLHFSARHLRDCPILLIMSKTTPITSREDLVKDWKDAERIEVGPLSEEEVHQAVASDTPPHVSIPSLRERTGGNPLLLASLIASGGLAEDEEIPATVVDYFRPRLDTISTPAHLLLASFATTSWEIPLGTRRQICGVSKESIAAAISELKGKHLLTVSDPPRPSHGLLSEVALANLDPANERALRGRVGRILAEGGRSSPAALAAQFDFAGESQKAYEAAVRAAQASQHLHASHEAEFFYKIALANAPTAEAEVDLRVKLAQTITSTGRFKEAKASLGSVDEIPPNTRAEIRAAFRATDLRLLLRNEPSNAAISAAWTFFDSAAPQHCALASAELLLTISSTAFELGRPEETLRAAEKVRLLAPLIADAPARASALARVASAVALARSYEEGLQAIERLLEDLPDFNRWPDSAVGFRLARGSALTAAGRLIEAESDFRAALELIESHGLYDRIFQVRNNLGVCLQEQGRYEEARAQLDAASRLSDTQAAPNGAAITTDNIAILHYESGDYRRAFELTANSLRTHEAMYDRSWFTRLGIRGLSALALNDVLDARESFREAELGFRELEKLPSDVSYIEIFIFRMLCVEGRQEDATTRLTAAINRCRPRELLSSVRMEIEKLKLIRRRNPLAAAEGARRLRLMLQGSGASVLASNLQVIENQSEG